MENPPCGAIPDFPALFGAILILGILGACVTPDRSKPTGPPDYSKPLPPGARALELVTDPAEYPDFAAGFRDREGLLDAVNHSLDFFSKPSARTHFPVEDISFSRARASLELFKQDLQAARTPEGFAGRIREHFDVYRSVGCDGRGTVLFTGYCEPVFDASPKRTETFRYPLYSLPDDLIKDPDGTIRGRRTATSVALPYYTRREIDGDGVLKDRGLELVWLESALEAYIVHVQGSASLSMPDGTIMKIGYAGKNGRPYRSLGQALIADGKMNANEASLDRIRAFFKTHPGEMNHYLFKNESYIFFTATEGGPYGSIGAQVTPYRTIATDKEIFPRGGVTFLDTTLPVRKTGRIVFEPHRGFALDQDKGSAIRSAGRTDIFMGTGREAEILAGRVRTEGMLYYLFAKSRALD